MTAITDQTILLVTDRLMAEGKECLKVHEHLFSLYTIHATLHASLHLRLSSACNPTNSLRYQQPTPSSSSLPSYYPATSHLHHRSQIYPSLNLKATMLLFCKIPPQLDLNLRLQNCPVPPNAAEETTPLTPYTSKKKHARSPEW